MNAEQEKFFKEKIKLRNASSHTLLQKWEPFAKRFMKVPKDTQGDVVPLYFYSNSFKYWVCLSNFNILSMTLHKILCSKHILKQKKILQHNKKNYLQNKKNYLQNKTTFFSPTPNHPGV